MDNFVDIPLKKKVKIFEFIKQKKINHLFTFCAEPTLHIIKYLNERLNQNQSYSELIKNVCNKKIFREKLLEYNIKKPYFSELKSKKQIFKNKIIKPNVGSGSKKIFLVNKSNIKDLKLKRYHNHIIEDFVEGEIYSIDGFVVENKFHATALSKKFRNNDAPLIDKKIIINYQNNDLFLKAINLTQKCCKAVNANNVPIHFEFIQTRDRKLYPIDFHIRGAGSMIFNHCLSEINGHDSSDYQIKLQLNKKYLLKRKKVFFICIF